MSPGDDAGVVKRSVAIAGHRTSVSLKDIAAVRGASVQALVGEIDAGRGGANLSSAIRVFVLREVRGR